MDAKLDSLLKQANIKYDPLIATSRLKLLKQLGQGEKIMAIKLYRQSSEPVKVRRILLKGCNANSGLEGSQCGDRRLKGNNSPLLVERTLRLISMKQILVT